MKQSVMLSLKRASQAYLVILPFAISGGITVGIYMIEHSAPEIIEASVEQLGSEQALIAVSTMQSLIYSLFAWVVGYFIVDRLGLIKPFRFEAAVLKKVCPVIVALGLFFAAVLLNGLFALVFGRWFRKYGIQYTMLGHFGIHLISKIILICVI